MPGQPPDNPQPDPRSPEPRVAKPPAFDSAAGPERVAELVDRYLDGGADAGELAVLRDALIQSAHARDLFARWALRGELLAEALSSDYADTDADTDTWGADWADTDTPGWADAPDSGLYAPAPDPRFFELLAELERCSEQAGPVNITAIADQRRAEHRRARAAALALTPVATADTIIYSEDFSGGAVALDGTTTDVGGGTWLAADQFSADGTVGGTTDGSAMLSFSPQDGTIYVLEATFTNATSNWLAVGFAENTVNPNQNTSEGAGARHSNDLEGWAWFLSRDISGPDQQLFGGARTVDPGPNDTHADGANPITAQIILDTQGGAGNWTAEYIFNGTSVTTKTLAAGASNIGAVGFSRDGAEGGGDATLDSFTLTEVPEPSSLALLGLGGLLIARRRRG